MTVEHAPILATLFALFSLGGGAFAYARSSSRDDAERGHNEIRFEGFARVASSDRVDLAALAPAEIKRRAGLAESGTTGAVKWLIDLIAAATLLIFFLPVILFTALAIKLDSPGPVLYRQKRIGRGGKPFEILKFRSMVTDAEREGAQWAAKNDSRITRIGRFIRTTRIDEIPQAFNVLRGEMSFVGPRPERPEFVKILEKEIPNYALRHTVLPGITGWAQVKYCYGASIEDARIKLQYDLFYIKNFSIWRDLKIILLTIRVAMFGLGSR